MLILLIQDGRRKAVYRSTPDISGLMSKPGSSKELANKSFVSENKSIGEKVNQLLSFYQGQVFSIASKNSKIQYYFSSVKLLLHDTSFSV